MSNSILGIYDTFAMFGLLTFHQKSYGIAVTLLVLKLLSETYFQCSFCDKLQLKESMFFIFENREPINVFLYFVEGR